MCQLQLIIPIVLLLFLQFCKSGEKNGDTIYSLFLNLRIVNFSMT
jgi:hypothetical protein